MSLRDWFLFIPLYLFFWLKLKCGFKYVPCGFNVCTDCGGSVVCEFVCGNVYNITVRANRLLNKKSYVQAPHYSAVIINQQKTLAAEGNF